MAGFWKNKPVLVTGYEGFLGSHLTKELLAAGALVVGLDIKTKRKETILKQADYRQFKVVRGNVADYPLLKKIFQENKIEIIFHLAAEALVGRCLKNPLKAFESNIAGTWVLLEAGREYGKLAAIICASSDKAYGPQPILPYREDFPLAGNHPYDVSKSCADLLANTYFHTFGLPVAITRCGNIFGPGDFNFSRVVPEAIRSAINGRTFNIRSDGQFTRDYVYVSDIVAGYLLLAELLREKKLAGKAFNFSAESPLTVLELIKTISAATGQKMKFKILNRARHEIRNQYLSAGRARRVLGWKPEVSLAAGLKNTISWYRENT